MASKLHMDIKWFGSSATVARIYYWLVCHMGPTYRAELRLCVHMNMKAETDGASGADR